jgi:hypothetical protein
VRQAPAIGRIQQCSPERGFAHGEHFPRADRVLLARSLAWQTIVLRPATGGRDASVLATLRSCQVCASARSDCHACDRSRDRSCFGVGTSLPTTAAPHLLLRRGGREHIAAGSSPATRGSSPRRAKRAVCVVVRHGPAPALRLIARTGSTFRSTGLPATYSGLSASYSGISVGRQPLQNPRFAGLTRSRAPDRQLRVKYPPAPEPLRHRKSANSRENL